VKSGREKRGNRKRKNRSFIGKINAGWAKKG
jgi:hypothetical protein